jgi:acetyl esterase/lipase
MRAESLSNPAPLGSPVPVSVVVSLDTTTASVPVTGVISVRENAVLLAQRQGTVDGAAVVIPISELPAGDHQLVVDFSGDDVEPNAVTVAQTVTPATTLPAISADDAGVDEGNLAMSIAAVPVWLSSVSAQSVTISYETQDGDAKGGTDYVAAHGSLTFAPGEVAKSIDLQIAGNTTAGPNRTFTVRLSSPAGATIARDTAAVTIVDDDAASRKSSFVYATAGATALNVDVDTPLGGRGPFPVVIWIGGISQYAPGSPSPAMHELARGYAVVTPSYRGSDVAPFPAQLVDLQAAIRWIHANATQLELDPQRIAVWGAGAGAHLATLLALSDGDETSRPQAAIDWGGATDLLTLQADVTNTCVDSHDAATSAESSLIGCALQSCPDAARAASPLSLVRSGNVPVLIMHGAGDCVIPPAQSRKLDEALRAAGSATTLRIVPGAGSPATAWWFSAAPFNDVDTFLDTHLKKSSKRRAAGK